MKKIKVRKSSMMDSIFNLKNLYASDDFNNKLKDKFWDEDLVSEALERFFEGDYGNLPDYIARANEKYSAGEGDKLTGIYQSSADGASSPKTDLCIMYSKKDDKYFLLTTDEYLFKNNIAALEKAEQEVAKIEQRTGEVKGDPAKQELQTNFLNRDTKIVEGYDYKNSLKDVIWSDKDVKLALEKFFHEDYGNANPRFVKENKEKVKNQYGNIFGIYPIDEHNLNDLVVYYSQNDDVIYLLSVGDFENFKAYWLTGQYKGRMSEKEEEVKGDYGKILTPQEYTEPLEKDPTIKKYLAPFINRGDLLDTDLLNPSNKLGYEGDEEEDDKTKNKKGPEILRKLNDLRQKVANNVAPFNTASPEEKEKLLAFLDELLRIKNIEKANFYKKGTSYDIPEHKLNKFQNEVIRNLWAPKRNKKAIEEENKNLKEAKKFLEEFTTTYNQSDAKTKTKYDEQLKELIEKFSSKLPKSKGQTKNIGIIGRIIMVFKDILDNQKDKKDKDGNLVPGKQIIYNSQAKDLDSLYSLIDDKLAKNAEEEDHLKTLNLPLEYHGVAPKSTIAAVKAFLEDPEKIKKSNEKAQADYERNKNSDKYKKKEHGFQIPEDIVAQLQQLAEEYNISYEDIIEKIAQLVYLENRSTPQAVEIFFNRIKKPYYLTEDSKSMNDSIKYCVYLNGEPYVTCDTEDEAYQIEAQIYAASNTEEDFQEYYGHYPEVEIKAIKVADSVSTNKFVDLGEVTDGYTHEVCGHIYKYRGYYIYNDFCDDVIKISPILEDGEVITEEDELKEIMVSDINEARMYIDECVDNNQFVEDSKVNDFEYYRKHKTPTGSGWDIINEEKNKPDRTAAHKQHRQETNWQDPEGIYTNWRVKGIRFDLNAADVDGITEKEKSKVYTGRILIIGEHYFKNNDSVISDTWDTFEFKFDADANKFTIFGWTDAFPVGERDKIESLAANEFRKQYLKKKEVNLVSELSEEELDKFTRSFGISNIIQGKKADGTKVNAEGKLAAKALKAKLNSQGIDTEQYDKVLYIDENGRVKEEYFSDVVDKINNDGTFIVIKIHDDKYNTDHYGVINLKGNKLEFIPRAERARYVNERNEPLNKQKFGGGENTPDEPKSADEMDEERYQKFVARYGEKGSKKIDSLLVKLGVTKPIDKMTYILSIGDRKKASEIIAALTATLNAKKLPENIAAVEAATTKGAVVPEPDKFKTKKIERDIITHDLTDEFAHVVDLKKTILGEYSAAAIKEYKEGLQELYNLIGDNDWKIVFNDEELFSYGKNNKSIEEWIKLIAINDNIDKFGSFSSIEYVEKESSTEVTDASKFTMREAFYNLQDAIEHPEPDFDITFNTVDGSWFGTLTATVTDYMNFAINIYCEYTMHGSTFKPDYNEFRIQYIPKVQVRIYGKIKQTMSGYQFERLYDEIMYEHNTISKLKFAITKAVLNRDENFNKLKNHHKIAESATEETTEKETTPVTDSWDRSDDKAYIEKLKNYVNGLLSKIKDESTHKAFFREHNLPVYAEPYNYLLSLIDKVVAKTEGVDVNPNLALLDVLKKFGNKQFNNRLYNNLFRYVTDVFDDMVPMVKTPEYDENFKKSEVSDSQYTNLKDSFNNEEYKEFVALCKKLNLNTMADIKQFSENHGNVKDKELLAAMRLATENLVTDATDNIKYYLYYIPYNQADGKKIYYVGRGKMTYVFKSEDSGYKPKEVTFDEAVKIAKQFKQQESARLYLEDITSGDTISVTDEVPAKYKLCFEGEDTYDMFDETDVEDIYINKLPSDVTEEAAIKAKLKEIAKKIYKSRQGQVNPDNYEIEFTDVYITEDGKYVQSILSGMLPIKTRLKKN